jgi:hypothetical protein
MNRRRRLLVAPVTPCFGLRLWLSQWLWIGLVCLLGAGRGAYAGPSPSDFVPSSFRSELTPGLSQTGLSQTGLSQTGLSPPGLLAHGGHHRAGQSAGEPTREATWPSTEVRRVPEGAGREDAGAGGLGFAVRPWVLDVRSQALSLQGRLGPWRGPSDQGHLGSDTWDRDGERAEDESDESGRDDLEDGDLDECVGETGGVHPCLRQETAVSFGWDTLVSEVCRGRVPLDRPPMGPSERF